MLKYKGYTGVVEYEPDDNVLHGRVIGIRDIVTFEADSVHDLEKEFRASIDDYLKWCAELGKEPNKPYSGNFSFRTTPELHQRIEFAAIKSGKSINAYMEEVLDTATRGKSIRSIGISKGGIVEVESEKIQA